MGENPGLELTRKTARRRGRQRSAPSTVAGRTWDHAKSEGYSKERDKNNTHPPHNITTTHNNQQLLRSRTQAEERGQGGAHPMRVDSALAREFVSL